MALLGSAELALDRGEVTVARGGLAELIEEENRGWPYGMAVALLALTYAVEGRPATAESSWPTASKARTDDPTAAQIDGLATAISAAQHGQVAGAAAALRSVDAHLTCHAVRCVERAVRASLNGGRLIGVDGPSARASAREPRARGTRRARGDRSDRQARRGGR